MWIDEDSMRSLVFVLWRQVPWESMPLVMFALYLDDNYCALAGMVYSSPFRLKAILSPLRGLQCFGRAHSLTQ